MTALVGEAALMPTYARAPLTLVRGEGLRVFDDEGRSYLDLVGGLGALSLGHAHPAWIEAVERAARTIGLTSNLFATPPQAELAARLASLLPIPDARVFFCNSGAEANEALLKLVRKHGLARGRSAIVALEGSFHGRTVAALAATGQPEKRAPFEPLVDWVRFVPAGDAEALAQAMAPGDVAGALLEPVMGEGGVIPLDPGYLRAVRDLCDAHDAVFAVDEVQAGAGRCGDWLSASLSGVVPDAATLAKALGGGLPIGALVARADLAFGQGEHASTFGGGPVPCAASLAVLATIEDDELLSNVLAMGDRLRAEAARLAPAGTLRQIRGRGLLCGFEVAPEIDAARVVAGLLARDVLVSTAGPLTIRLTPPFTIAAEEVDVAVTALAAALEEAAP